MLRYYLNGLKKIFSVAKKALLVFIVFSTIIILFSYFIKKDKIALSPSISHISQVEKNRAEVYKVINDKELNKTQQGKVAIALFKSTMCGMIGEACTNNPKDGDKNFNNSIFGFISKLIITPFANPPASGVMWVYSGLQNAGFVPKTMAAEGIGFTAIKPFANLWKIFRDISYMLLVIILISIGFLIMFRAKLNPQTVMTVENALPKIVISLLLITFSFAIAGFLIDLMYVLITIIISILSNNNNNFNAVNYQNEFIGAGLGHIFKDAAGRTDWGKIIPDIGDSIMGIFPPFIIWIFRGAIGFIAAIWFHNVTHMSIVKPLLESLNNIGVATFNIGELIGGILGPIGSILVLIATVFVGMTIVFTAVWYILIGGTVIFVAFRIIALLFSSYIKLILFVIISPLLLLFESIPGKNVFSYWIKNIIGFLLPFPITIAVSLLGYIIINSTTPAGYTDVRLPYLFGIDSHSFKILIGMGLIFIIPDLVKLLKEALGIKEAPPLFGLGTFFGGAAAVGGTATGLATQLSSWNLASGAFRTGGMFEKFGSKAKTSMTSISSTIKGLGRTPKSSKADPGYPGSEPQGE